jgi:hypothetical protein
MEKHISAANPVCVFLMGVNDEKTAAVRGLGKDGQVFFALTGNTDFNIYTQTSAANKRIMTILWFEDKGYTVSKPDIFVNCISDADNMEKSLGKAIGYMDEVRNKWPDVSVFNDPRRIADTRRDAFYKKFNGLPGIEIPKALRFQPKNREDVLLTAQKEGFTFPYIVRPCGSHNARNMVLVESSDRADVLDCLAFDGSYFYITQFRDYKNDAGLYIKSRFVVMDGKIYPRHLITARSWKVNASSRVDLMQDSAELREQERQDLSAFEKKISPQALESVQKIYNETGLDYLGFDCSILPNGNLLFFEVNATMNAMGKADYDVYPYQKSVEDNMINAYNALLAGKIGARKDLRRA